MNTDNKLLVTSSPHVRTADDTRSIMLDVIISLLPALAAAVYFFGGRALVLTLVSVAFCVFFEWAYRKLMKKTNTIGDLSAVVTGMLLAFCLPVGSPYWMVAIGDFFAIVIVKQLYGGLGKNFVNPALAARAFLFSFPVYMSTWAASMTRAPIFGAADAVTAATPLYYMSTLGEIPKDFSLYQLFIGRVGGCIGEICTLALILGGVYLLLRRVITPRIPVAFIGVVALLTFVFPRGSAGRLEWMLYSIMSGGVFLGAIFMATDYATSPVTKAGQWVYGAGCGALTVFIRYFGSYPEGVSYAILIMNSCVWLIERVTVSRRYGCARKAGEAK
ncbi:MAG: RnfABCDGE type electron transport complex subunit D [Oscillospiraceae bacterium]|jgi:electron transport complex protein RnfD